MIGVRGSTLAIHGGRPVRRSMLPFAVSSIGEEEIREVVDTLRSGWLATGPKTAEFERRFADYVGCRYAVGTTSGTSALGLVLDAIGVAAGDEVVTASLTYVASAHAIVHLGATPVFADVDRCTLNLDPASVEERITPATRAILLTHFAGRPCELGAFETIAARHGIPLISDSAHAIETRYEHAPLAPRFRASAYSFHPVKNLTTGEGGMVTTDDEAVAAELRLRRAHGIDRDAWTRRGASEPDEWDVTLLGHKCNMSDVQASLGLHQLARLERNLERRRRIAARYTAELADLDRLALPAPVPDGQRHAWHLYTVVWKGDADRAVFRRALRAENVATGLHYPPIHRTTFYRRWIDTADERLPATCEAGERIVTLPLYPAMSDDDVESVVEAVRKVTGQLS